MKDPIQLSPYPHELNYRGTRCALDCPACRWRQERLAAEFATSNSMGRKVLDYVHCELFQIGLEELGLV